MPTLQGSRELTFQLIHRRDDIALGRQPLDLGVTPDQVVLQRCDDLDVVSLELLELRRGGLLRLEQRQEVLALLLDLDLELFDRSGVLLPQRLQVHQGALRPLSSTRGHMDHQQEDAHQQHQSRRQLHDASVLRTRARG